MAEPMIDGLVGLRYGRVMRIAFPLALSLALGAFVMPAHAQMSSTGMGGVGGGPKVEPKIQAPNIAPAGLPGVGAVAPLATGPKMQAPSSGDPTQELFQAISNNNYASAEDAVSRGADLRALDQFGETPLDLSIALNRNDITFMLLGTRNELVAQGEDSNSIMGKPWTLSHDAKQGRAGRKAKSFVSVREAQKVEVPAGDTGTPAPQAGFLGFGPKN